VKDIGNTLFVLRLVKLVLEIALLALAGQGIVWVLIRAAGQAAERNFAYRALQTIATPFTRLVRLVTPKLVLDRHVPWATAALLAVAYAWVLFTIANTCIGAGLTIAECQRLN
jgi:predicted NBD/HSP70 family sugar kinase